jgi:wyosine [tRNA(Phe)-imidazoG37] synthetase (radical SAM superfamily)
VKYLYGPVPSRRLGSSLGVDLVPHKVCSFDCIYCQLGKTTHKTTQRREYVPAHEVLDEVKNFIGAGHKCDYITLAGSGEPTLNSRIGWMINEIKNLTDIPVAVLTNTSLIADAKIKVEISQADLVLPSLDAVTQKMFEQINRPYPGLKISDIMEGLIKFNRKSSGEVWLEVMLIEGFNNDAKEIKSIQRAIHMLKPNKIHLNTVVRPASEVYAQPLTEDDIGAIAATLGAEVIADFKRKDVHTYKGDKEELMLNLLKRRPCTISDISSALGLHENEVIKYVEVLFREGIIEVSNSGGKKYFKCAGGF